MFRKFIILFYFFSQLIFCQTIKLPTTRIDFIEMDADFFIGFDGFKNYYYLKNNILYKKNDTSILQYQNLYLGKISKVDILNPLKIIVFYESFNSVILLDNQLNEIQKIEFSNLETPILATAVSVSGQNKLWVFDGLNQQLGLLNLSTNQFQIIGNPIKNGILNYQTNFNYFHYIDKNNDWNTYNIYGQHFQDKAIEKNIQTQFIDNEKYFFTTNDSLFLKDLSSDKLYEIEIVEKTFKKMYYKDQILSIFTHKGITNYKIIIP